MHHFCRLLLSVNINMVYKWIGSIVYCVGLSCTLSTVLMMGSCLSFLLSSCF